jgi:hypothetical protein
MHQARDGAQPDRGARSTAEGPVGASPAMAARGGGAPLAPAVRAEMELRFDADFADVRIHADGEAAAQAQRLGANAFTIGPDISFAAGLYDTRAEQGRRLLAHELAHVVQQSRGGPLPAGSSAAEHGAAAAAGRVTAGAQAAVTGGAATGTACERKDPHKDFYWTAFYANRAWARGTVGHKIEGFPVDPDLAELWAKVDAADERNGAHDPAFMAFADRVKSYQAEVMADRHPADGVVDPATAASLKAHPITRIGVTTLEERKPPLQHEQQSQAKETPAYSVADDSLGQYEDMAVNAAASAIANGNPLEKRLVAAAMRGFVKELIQQLVTQHKADRARARLEELKNPSVAVAFYASYVAGVAAGLVSPLTDLIGLATLADALPALRRKLAEAVFTHASELGADLDAIITKVGEVSASVSSKVAATMKKLAEDPKEIFAMIESASASAENMAGRMGHGAAGEVIAVFQSPWDEAPKKDPGWRSVLPANAVDALSDPSAAVNATAARAFEYGSEKVKDKLFSTPWSKAGYAVGHVIGAVISNVALLVFTDGIGNAIAKIGEGLAKLAPMLRTIGSAVSKVGEVIGLVEHAIGMLVGLAAKPLEPILKPLGELFARLRTFLGRLLGVAEEEGAALAAAARKTLPLLEEGGAREIPKPHPPIAVGPANGVPPELGKAPPVPRAGAGAARAETTVPKPRDEVTPFKRAERPKVSPATVQMQRNLEARAPEKVATVSALPVQQVDVAAAEEVASRPLAANEVGNRPVGSAGGKPPQRPKVVDVPPASRTKAPVRPGGGGGGGGRSVTTTPPGAGASPPPRLRVVPNEPPLPASQKMAVKQRAAFYEANKGAYSPAIRKQVDSLGKRPTKAALERIDKAIRDQYAADLAHATGIPVKQAGRIPTSGPGGSGGDWEKTMRSLNEGRRPQLSVSSKTKAGETVQIDALRGKVPREYKASLEYKGKDPQWAERQMRARMEKHAEFARDHGLDRYEWVAHSQDMFEEMERARAGLPAGQRDRIVVVKEFFYE